MSNFAVIKNGIVTNIVIADVEWADAQTDTVIEYTESNPAYIGGEYVNGLFYSPQPFPSWVKVAGQWQAPIPMPTDAASGHAYIWNELITDWQDIEVSA